MIKQYW